MGASTAHQNRPDLRWLIESSSAGLDLDDSWMKSKEGMAINRMEMRDQRGRKSLKQSGRCKMMQPTRTASAWMRRRDAVATANVSCMREEASDTRRAFSLSIFISLVLIAPP